MRMFDRDPRLESEEVLDAVKPEPEEPKQLSVAELVLLLQHEDQELLVEIEGCDCWGAAIGIELYDGKLIITRSHGLGIK